MRIAHVTKILIALTAIAMALSFFGKWHFMLDNLSSFRVHFALVLFLGSAILLTSRQLGWSGLAFIGSIMSLVAIVPWYVPPGGAPALLDQPTISVMTSNVSSRLDQHDRLLSLIDREQPEILGLIEITPRFLTGLASLKTQYPFHYEAPYDGFWGLALYSKLPLTEARLVRFGEGVPPAIVANLKSRAGEIELILVHMSPPTTARFAKLRNTQLDALAGYVRESGRSSIVLGDLNVALWSPYYRDFMAKSGLRNARRGHGVAMTWPPNRVLGVPIDHILYSNDVIAHGFRVLPGIGSDHFPIAAELGLGFRHGKVTSRTRPNTIVTADGRKSLGAP